MRRAPVFEMSSDCEDPDGGNVPLPLVASSTICGKCGGHYRDPRLLSCLHVFCLQCLESAAWQDTVSVCPSCSVVSPGPPNLLARHIQLDKVATVARRLSTLRSGQPCGSCDSKQKAEMYCYQCDCGLCSTCVAAHKSLAVLKSHKLESVSSLTSSSSVPVHVQCSTHPDVTLKYYCTTCSCMICSECYMFEHRTHEYSRIDVILSKEKANISALLATLEKAHPKVTKASEEVKHLMNDVASRKDQVRSEIEGKFQEIMALVEKCQQELLAELDDIASAKSTVLQEQCNTLDQLAGKIQHTIQSCTVANDVYTASEFLAVKGTLSQATTSLIREMDEVKLEPTTDGMISCGWSSKNTKSVKMALTNLGSVVGKVPYLVDINPEMPIEMAVNKQCRVVLQATSKKGEKLEVRHIKSCLSDQSGDKTADVSVKGEHRFELLVTPPFVGQQLLHVQVCGDEAVIDGPYSVNVVRTTYSDIKDPVLRMKTPSKPSYLYVDKKGNIYTTFDSGSIIVYSKDGREALNIPGTDLDLSYARGIVVDEVDEVMYIASAGNNKIVKATLNGKVIVSVGGNSGSRPLQFNFPMGLCLDETASLLYVADNLNKRIQILNSTDLSYVDSLVCRSKVWGVAIDNSGNIYAGTTSSIIEVFSSVSKQQIAQVNLDKVSAVGDISFTTAGHCIISNYTKQGGLIVLGKDMNIINIISVTNNPLGIFVDQIGYLYVAVYDSKQILKY